MSQKILRSVRSSIGPVMLQLALVSAPFGTSIGASYLIPRDEVLIGKADLIVRGHVLGVAPSIGADGGIHTDVTVAVAEVLKGAADGATVVVRQPGGTFGELSEHYPGIGVFSEGEEVLLMLDRQDEAPFRLTDFALGRFQVLTAADGTPYLRRDGLQDAFVVGAPAADGAWSEPDRNAAAFERFVREVAAGASPVPDYTLDAAESGTDRVAEFVFLGSPPARWIQFDAGTTVTYKDNVTGDAGSNCAGDGCHDEVASGVAKWRGLPGARILLEYGGTDATMGNKCLGALSDQIQYNDPCNEISNLVGCAGTLALGGFTSSTASGGAPPCPSMGNPSFQKIERGKILVNNNVGSCLNSCDYTEMIAHETGHTLGAGHTSVSGALMQATLNHGLCGTVRADDLAFAQCSYPEFEVACTISASRTWGGPPPMSVTFGATASGGLPPYSYTFDFGDGASSTASNPSHAYSAAGTYEASVTVTDAQAATCTNAVSITVQPCAAPAVTSVTAAFRYGIWRAIVLGKGFKKGAVVQIDSGGGFVPAPKTRWFSKSKVVGRDVAAIWPAGTPVRVRVINPGSCPSNEVQATR